MARKSKRIPCAYRDCEDEVIKTLATPVAAWAYCFRHHVAAARARERFNLTLPAGIYVKTVA
jgi:hypothetical protein